jgi:hypothetical protein
VGWRTPPLAQPVIPRIEHLVEGDVVEKCHTDEMMPVGYDSKHGAMQSPRPVAAVRMVAFGPDSEAPAAVRRFRLSR